MFNGLKLLLEKPENEFEHFLRGTTSNEESNLADIFETDDLEHSNEVGSALKYVPLKSTQSQPQKMNQTDKDKPTWTVIIAKIVTAYKLVNDTNTSIGHLGFALLQNPSEDASKLILYKTKEQILSTFLLKKTTKVYWKPPYLQYHDDMNGFWSLLFTHDSDCDDFIAKLKLVCDIDQPDTMKFDRNDGAKIAESENEVDVVDYDLIPKTKSDVLYRVAKTGHQLPKFNSVADDDDRDITLSSDIEKVSNIKSYHGNPEQSGILPPKPPNISVALQPTFWPSSTFDINSFVTENRIQNTEVRMNLSKLDSKFDRILDKFERLRLNTSGAIASDIDEEIIKLEEKVLELKKENRALKMQLTEGAKVTVDETETKKMELQTKVNQQEHHIAELKSKWQETEQILKMERESIEKKEAEITASHAKELHTLREELEKKNVELENLQQQLKEQQDQNNKSTGNANNGDMIRNIMNQFYLKLYESIEGKDSMSSTDILKLTAEIIRKETKAALNSN